MAEYLLARRGEPEIVFAITDGASVDLDPANGGIQTWTLGANRTVTESFTSGHSMTLIITSAGYAVTWPTILWVGGDAPTLATGESIVELFKAGSTLYGVAVGDPSSGGDTPGESGDPEWTLSGFGAFSTETANGSPLTLTQTDTDSAFLWRQTSSFLKYSFDDPSNPDIANTSLQDNRSFTAPSGVDFWMFGGFWTTGGEHFFGMSGYPNETRNLYKYTLDSGQTAYTFSGYDFLNSPDQSVNLTTLFSADRIGGVIINDAGTFGIIAITTSGSDIFQRFSMSEPFDLTTISVDAGQSYTPENLALSSNAGNLEYQVICSRLDPTGLALFVMAQFNNGSDYIAIREYVMTAEMDLTTMSYSGNEIDVSNLSIFSTPPFAFDFSRSATAGDNLFVGSTNRIHQASK